MNPRLLVSLFVAVASAACASSSPEQEVPTSTATEEPTTDTTATATASGPAAGPGAARHAEITIGDDAAAEAVFKTENAKLIACYEAELRDDPTVTIQWAGSFTTDPSGAVSKVDLFGVYPELAKCISGVIKATKHASKGAPERTFIVTMWTGDKKPTL